MDEHNLEGLKMKYPCWLKGHQEEKSATSLEKVDLDDTATFFSGKKTRVEVEMTSTRGVSRTKRRQRLLMLT
jgi:hypothetical protein